MTPATRRAPACVDAASIEDEAKQYLGEVKRRIYEFARKPYGSDIDILPDDVIIEILEDELWHYHAGDRRREATIDDVITNTTSEAIARTELTGPDD